jgi:hypothetical protein
VTTLPFSIEVPPSVDAVFAAGLVDIFFTRRAVCVNSPTLLAALRPHWLGGLPRVQALLRLLPEIVGTAPGTGILRPETGGEIALTPRTETGIGKTEDKKPRQWRAFLDGLRKVRKQQTGWWRMQSSETGLGPPLPCYSLLFEVFLGQGSLAFCCRWLYASGFSLHFTNDI